MIYGVSVSLKSGTTEHLAVSANTQRAAADNARKQFEEHQIETVLVQTIETVLYEQYDGVAVLTTGV